MDKTIAMKRLEIVIGIEQLEELMELLGKSDVRGYTVIKNAGGYGSRGARDPNDVLMEQENVVVVLACKEDQAQSVVGNLRPVMKRLGGMCLVSDCLWVEGPAVSY
ncbi:nitrogen regulatory protein P-II family [Nitrosomonas sp. PY1]|uniref:P-II family nitrogen regulator n=1 Tax=Nitrosomonas sp. PY1 TaxID=1803906 RepID=UPI001FC8CFFC|nr:transcriptional regulator [Nitrosomonas sp. PY1]GKS68746.1 nitrogen regulatory protein P-II family [Nitrosomonas sp. PY1]